VIAGNGGIELQVTEDSRLSALPPSLTDLDAITILGNLVENATEAVSGMADGRRRIAVNLDDRGDELLLRVRDWGPGIRPGEASTVFRCGYSTKSDHVGLGLALVQSIVVRAGGTIEVEQPDGGGVAFCVRIPV
jgi:two-component system, CitB family, sensor kinase